MVEGCSVVGHDSSNASTSSYLSWLSSFPLSSKCDSVRAGVYEGEPCMKFLSRLLGNLGSGTCRSSVC